MNPPLAIALTLAIVLLSVPLAVLGAVMLIRATRYVDDSPHCLVCTYDIRALAPTTRCCPECGADLARARTGVETNWPLLFAGVSSLLGVVILFGVAAWLAFLL